jgi:putative nucleotidyltransferase with HDIG domain
MSIKQMIVDSAETMPPMPDAVVKMGNLLSDPDTEIEDIVKVIQFDPGFTANVLKLANSALLGFPSQVGSLNDAVIRIGTQKIFQIMVANSLKPVMNRDLSGYGLHSADFWEHSIAVAVTAEDIASTCPKTMADSFTAGLLHDVGKLIISDFIAKEHGRFEADMDEDMSFDSMENRMFGVDHAEIGAIVLEKWKFPQSLVDIARFHHHPDKAVENQMVVDQVHVADLICLCAGIGAGYDGLKYGLSCEALERLSLDDIKMEAILCRTLDSMEEFKGLLSVIS